jgi:hypothetical protein
MAPILNLKVLKMKGNKNNKRKIYNVSDLLKEKGF